MYFYKSSEILASDYFISDIKLSRASSISDLGVIFDHNLKFDIQSSAVTIRKLELYVLGFI